MTRQLLQRLSNALPGDDDPDERGQLGVFMVLIMGAVALVTVSIILLFGMNIAASFAGSTGDTFTATESVSGTSPFDYTVTRAPQNDTDVVALDDTVTVTNTSSGATLTAGTDYEWFPDNGTVSIQDGSTTATTYQIEYSGRSSTYGSTQRSTTDSTGQAFELFGTSVLVIPAAAVLAVLIGGMVGAIAGGGNLPGMGGSNGRNRRR